MNSGSEKDPSQDLNQSGSADLEEPQQLSNSGSGEPEVESPEQDPEPEVEEEPVEVEDPAPEVSEEEPEVQPEVEEEESIHKSEEPIEDAPTEQTGQQSLPEVEQDPLPSNLETSHDLPEVLETQPNEEAGDDLKAPLIARSPTKKQNKVAIRKPTTDKKGRQVYKSGMIAFDDDSFISKTLFFHLNKIVNAGNKEPYKFNMLYELDDEFLYADYIGFEKFFKQNQKKYEKDVLAAVFAYNSKYIWIANIVFVFRYFLECSFPLLLKQMLNWIELEDNGNLDMTDGYVYATLISLFVVLRSYCGLLTDYILEIVNARIRNNLRVSDLDFKLEANLCRG